MPRPSNISHGYTITQILTGQTVTSPCDHLRSSPTISKSHSPFHDPSGLPNASFLAQQEKKIKNPLEPEAGHHFCSVSTHLARHESFFVGAFECSSSAQESYMLFFWFCSVLFFFFPSSLVPKISLKFCNIALLHATVTKCLPPFFYHT